MSAALVGASFAAALALRLLFAPRFESWDRQAADQLFRLRHRIGGRQAISPYLFHVVLTDGSLGALGLPSWDRSVFGRLFDLLQRSDARLVVCDVFFRDPGPAGSDELLVAAAGGLGRLVLPVLAYSEQPPAGGAALPPPELLRRCLLHPEVARDGTAPPAAALVAPFPALARTASALGHINLAPDRDGVGRRVPLLYRREEGYVPSLSLQAALQYFEVDSRDVEVSFGRHIVLRQALIGDGLRRDLVIPIDRSGNLIVNFAGPWGDSFPSFPVHRLLAASGGEELAELLDLLEGALVVVSDVTTANRDYGPGVFESVYPLSGVHASVLNSLLTGELLRPQRTLPGLLAAAALLLLLWLACWRFDGLRFTLAAAALGLAFLAYAYWLFAARQTVPAVAAPLLALAMTLATANAHRLLVADRARSAHRAELDARKRLAQAKVTFVQNVAHELRSPLTLIQQPLEAIAHGAEQGLPAGVSRNIDRARAGARRLSALVDQFLDLSKIQAGLAPLRVSDGNLTEFLAAQALRFQPVAADRGVRLEFTAGQRPVACRFDADKMESIVSNLLSNALKAAPDDGLVRLGLRYPAAAGMAEITVSDDGPGIPTEELPGLFQRFHQGRSAQGPGAVGGSGVGLALAKECVEAHGGRIEAANLPGGGARFTVLLPCAGAPAAVPAPAPAAVPALTPAQEPATPSPERSRGSFPPAPVLIVEDETEVQRALMAELAEEGIDNLIPCSSGSGALSLLASESLSAVLLDLGLPDVPGRQLLARLREEHPECPVIVVTGLQDVEAAVECVRLGAAEYLVKPVAPGRLASSLRRSLEKRDLEEQMRSLRRRIRSMELKNPEAFAGIVTGSPAMLSRFRYVEAVAESASPVLITGESGVGKELVARTIHLLSRRSGGFVSENIAGLDDTVITDTLFGHSRGAFTDASSFRRGLVEEAQGGTLFLDEIGDMSVTAQVKLLRFIENGEFRPLGSDNPKLSDARVILATNVDLARRLQEGRFREDLFYRLTYRVDIPPLRERMEDLPLLIAHFVEQNCRRSGREKPALPDGLLDLLRSYGFPGNVRELKNMIDDALSRGGDQSLSLSYFRDYIRGSRETGMADALPTLKASEERLIAEALRRTGGNQNAAARLLGLSPSALSRRLGKGRRPA